MHRGSRLASVLRRTIAKTMPEHKPNATERADLSGQVVLITGGARRIGACLAETLHAAGMQVILHYRSSATLAHALQEKLNSQRENSCLLMQCDLAQTGKLKPMVDECVKQAGRLDVLVNNASAFYPTPIGKTETSQWDTLLDVNLKAPYFLSQAAAPHLRKSGGCIVNLVDIYADRPLRDHAVYSASKAGLLSLTRSFAQQLAPEVRVNGISPGAILWPENDHDEIGQQRLLSRVPLKRTGDPEDIARTALFLIRSAPYITGHVIPVDGGRSVLP